MNINTPEFYGYKIGENIAPYINKCIDETGECYISEGEHIFGRNDEEWHKGHVWSDSCITWGWNRFDNIKLIGAGYNKTIFKLIDNVNSKNLFGTPAPIIHMLSTNYNVSCDNNLIEGITFDGNYENNHDISTICAIRMRGSNNTVKNCRFINFGPGNQSDHECFQVFCVGHGKLDDGAKILNNIFESVGKKKNSKKGHCPENTFVAVGGKAPQIKYNTFKNCEFDIVNQQSPLHAITIADSLNAEITDNTFENFQGNCIYIDSWTNKNAVIVNNRGTNIWNFIALTCQHWQNQDQISYSEDFCIENNDVVLSDGDIYYQWDQQPIVSVFFAYNHDPKLNINIYTGFKNIVAKDNKITLGHRIVNGITEVSNVLKCYWGYSASTDKILLTNNQIFSNITKPIEKLSIFRRFINWLLNIFK
jgi:hypothetical protein